MIIEHETLRRVQDGVIHLTRGLTPFVQQKMQGRHGAKWLHYASRSAGGQPNDPLDAYGLLKTIIDKWADVFAGAFPRGQGHRFRNAVSTALEGRNDAAHAAGTMGDQDALRYLDAMCVVLELSKAPEAEHTAVVRLYEEQRRGGLSEPAATPPVAPKPHPVDPAQPRFDLSVAPDAPARPWREVVLPQTDVLDSSFREAEFAADLNAVANRLIDPESDYARPEGFFRITFLTEGLKRVLSNALDRLAGKGGEPVVGLQTAFGGGKTHTMLAVYHMASARDLTLLPGVADLAQGKGIAQWRPISCFIFVGTAVPPGLVLYEQHGLRLTTLWGAMARDLGGMPGYRLVQDAEEAWVNPGSTRLVEVLKLAAPCAILLDEVVAYARQLTGPRSEAFLTFCQSLTEAAKLVPGVLVVSSLPESRAEAGSERGEEALFRLEKVFGRVQSPWLPASGDETYEIVRRRLFQPLDEDGVRLRDQAVKAFHDLYRKNPAEFPPEVREPRYLELMRLSYPIHPDLLERLSKDWAGLPKFQRTRGVLRFLAYVTNILWKQQSNDPLITSARLPLSHERVRANALDPLPGEFAAIVDKEVDGTGSLPDRMESNATRRISQAKAATRAARAVFLGSAPLLGRPNAGVTGQQLRLACAEPGDQLAIFGEALRELSERATYLYEEGGRYWFSTQPTLNRLAQDRAQSLDAHEVDAAIVDLLREEGATVGRFDRVFAAPDDPPAIDEARALSLVILGPAFPHTGRTAGDSLASRMVAETLTQRRTGQRCFRNTLVFLAPDDRELDRAREAMRRSLAWDAIIRDDRLMDGLTRGQADDAAEKAKQNAEAAHLAVRAAWMNLFYPERSAEPGRPFDLAHACVRIRERGPVVPMVYSKVIDDRIAQEKLGPDTFRWEIEPLWPADQPHLAISEIEAWFATYVYLPRLRDVTVLRSAIRTAIGFFDPPFGYADGVEGDGYKNLSWAKPPPPVFPPGAVLVRSEEVWRWLPPRKLGSRWSPGAEAVAPGADDGALRPSTEGPGTPVGRTLPNEDGSAPPRPSLHGRGTGTVAPVPASPMPPTRFYGSVEIDPERPIRAFEQIVTAIIQQLQRVPGAKITLTLEVEATAPQGFGADDVSVVRDNAKQLRFQPDATGFEE